MEEIMQEFIDISDEPYKWLSDWKDANKQKLVGCYPMYVPEEIIHAGGAMPFVMQRSKELMTLSPRWLQSYFCDFSRSTLDILLKDDTGLLDGLVIGDTCHVNQGLYHIITKELPQLFRHPLQLPKDLQRESSRELLYSEFQQFKTVMEKLTGSAITDDKLNTSIAIYNENRAAIRDLYDLRRRKPGAIKAMEIQSVVRASMLMPKEEHTKRLRELLPQLEQRESVENQLPKLFLTGSMCEDVLLDLLNFIEDMGSVVVDDDLYMGYRYVAVHGEGIGDPIESLCSRYLNMIPCPTRYRNDWDWGNYLVERIKQTDAQGVVVIVVTHCEPHWYAYPNLKNKLNAAGIPHFYLESEQESISLGRIRTRIEAFLEMLKGGA